MSRRSLLPPARARRATLLAAVVAATLLATPATAQAAPPATPDGRVEVADPNAPTAAELAAQRAEAERLQREVDGQTQDVADARTRLADLAEQAGAALEAYQGAVRAQHDAEAERTAQEKRLAAARALVGEKQGDLNRWVSSAYRDGIAAGEYEALMTLLESTSTDDLSQRLVMLQQVGRLRGDVVTTVKDAEAVQRDAAARARAAAVAADLAAERAATHRADADRLVAEQRQQTEDLTELLASTRSAAQGAEQAAADLKAARAAAEQRRLAAVARGAATVNAVTGETGDCQGGDVSQYANGQIPLSALCPVADGHRLRADAAYALQQLNDAYREQWGTSLCITDSYRSLAGQVSTFAAKPGLAATPGTSNHGWGTAVDLCGGIESFGSETHRWMQGNAPLFGWFHPAWAQAGGSKPEPWHWEYGG